MLFNCGILEDSMDMNLSKLWESMMDREVWHAAVLGATKSQTRPSDWTELIIDLTKFWEDLFYSTR